MDKVDSNMGKKDFFSSPMYTILSYIYYFAAANLLFLLSNIIFIATLAVAEPNIYAIILLFITAIPCGPSISALLSIMEKLIIEKEISVWKDYITAYKQNFKQSLKTWMIILLSVIILAVDIKFVSSNSDYKFTSTFFLGLMIIVILIGLYSFSILSKFKMGTKDVILLSIYFSIRKFPVTILKLAIIASIFWTLKYFKIVGFLFFTSIIAYLIMCFDEKMIIEIKEKFDKDNLGLISIKTKELLH